MIVRGGVAVLALALIGGLAGVPRAHATGLATCDSGPEAGWRSRDALTRQLTERGWQVRRVKVDGGCYEVYAVDDKGDRVEAYFHPVTFESVLTSRR